MDSDEIWGGAIGTRSGLGEIAMPNAGGRVPKNLMAAHRRRIPHPGLVSSEKYFSGVLRELPKQLRTSYFPGASLSPSKVTSIAPSAMSPPVRLEKINASIAGASARFNMAIMGAWAD